MHCTSHTVATLFIEVSPDRISLHRHPPLPYSGTLQYFVASKALHMSTYRLSCVMKRVNALFADGFTEGQLRLSGKAQKCYVRTVQVFNVCFGKVPGAFLSQKHPLGVVREHVTLLSLWSVTLGSPCIRSNVAVPEEAARASSR